jgi:C4-dicarboxylate transporter
LEATAPLQSGRSYFFFAFLAFLAAFFAFLAIVPPEGVGLCLMATTGEVH